jgi:SulP family sulfate permease
MWRSKKLDFLIALCSFALTIGLGIEMGIGAAFAFSILCVVLQSTRPSEEIVLYPSFLSPSKQSAIHETSPGALPTHDGIFLWRMCDSLYFANKNHIKDRVAELLQMATQSASLSSDEPDVVRYFIIDAVAINSIDTDGVHALQELFEYLKRQRVVLLLTRLQREPYNTLLRSGLFADIGKGHVFPDVSRAIAYARGVRISSIQSSRLDSRSILTHLSPQDQVEAFDGER